MQLDHVILAATDLDAEVARVRDELGLVARGGGRHEGVGTHNRIVPLGRGYLEIMAVADPGEAAASPLGRTLAAAIARRAGTLMAYCVVVPDVEAVAARLGTGLARISRQGLTAALTATEEAMAEPFLPFFLERDHGIADPSAGADAGGLTWVEVSGAAARLREWLGGEELPIRVVDGPPAVRAMGIGDRELRRQSARA